MRGDSVRTKIATAFVTGLAVLAATGTIASANASAGTTIPFVSGTDWTTFSTDPGSTPFLHTSNVLGQAQAVCMSVVAPPTCPGGATVYNSPFYGWTADLSPIPGAAWIWRPGIDGQSTPADLADYFFAKTLILAGEPTGGILYVAVDDFAAVRVNHELVGTLGSVVDASLAGKHTYLTPFDVSPYLHPGRNVVTVEAQNGPAHFSGLCGQCSYALNPAGVVFGGSLSFNPPAAHEQLGGLQLDEFCKSLGYDGVVLTRPRLGSGAAIGNWRCSSAGDLHPFSMEQACKWEYGLDTVQPHFLDRDDAYSWKCFAV
jgi:hypothetical protein